MPHTNPDSNMTINQNSDINVHQENIQQYKENGTLRLFVGPMYAGKTSKLIETYKEAIKNKQNVIVLTHSSEIRYSIDQLSTHDQKQISCFKYDKINTFVQDKHDDISHSQVILIDEAQFFEDLIEIRELVDTHHKHIFVFGLDGDFKRNKFGHILDLIPVCDSVEKLTAKCNMCNNKAIFSRRIISSEQQVLVGSSESYQPMCRKCYNSN
jgi:thymidine kinase